MQCHRPMLWLQRYRALWVPGLRASGKSPAMLLLSQFRSVPALAGGPEVVTALRRDWPCRLWSSGGQEYI
jgi:hypothetical protein